MWESEKRHARWISGIYGRAQLTGPRRLEQLIYGPTNKWKTKCEPNIWSLELTSQKRSLYFPVIPLISKTKLPLALKKSSKKKTSTRGTGIMSSEARPKHKDDASEQVTHTEANHRRLT
jgi:hypothetical protein